MKWIELIRVRSSETALKETLTTLQHQVQEIEEASDGVETFFMRHALYDGDLALVIVWRSEVEPQKTREGLLVAERLKELGTVDHAVWVPAKD